jgi:hypothetical protein
MILILNSDVDVTSAIFVANGGPYLINVRGDVFDGAIVEIQTASPNDTAERFATLSNGTLTFATSIKLDYLPQGTKLRVDLNSTGASTDNIFVDILSV